MVEQSSSSNEKLNSEGCAIHVPAEIKRKNMDNNEAEYGSHNAGDFCVTFTSTVLIICNYKTPLLFLR